MLGHKQNDQQFQNIKIICVFPDLRGFNLKINNKQIKGKKGMYTTK